MAYTVFISHSVRDLWFVSILKNWLESRGIHVYIAEEWLEAGIPLPKKIAKAIDGSDVVLAL
ncbi:MAG: toll/interleukin-1 receptor domain-containing protein [Candidatus Verstraetearchaeota archaeon]|nr:toll/interleukin-1 receptor domain-containing protein [Candidatus Verstraetearchaeota archaeon]